MWVNGHWHLDYFAKPGDVVKHAIAKRVGRILTNTTTLESIQKGLALQEQFKEVKACVGYYPGHVIEDNEERRKRTIALVKEKASKAVGFGEIGLDFEHAKTASEQAVQESVFKELCGIALEHGKPIIVHSRKCQARILEVIEEAGNTKVLLHSYVGKAAHARKVIEAGHYVSVGFGVLERKWMQEWVTLLPLERILLESDSPLKIDGKTIDCSIVAEIAKKVSELKGVSLAALESIQEKNVKALFGNIL